MMLGKREGCGEQREQSGFGNSLGSNAKSFITFLLFSKMIESS
jgi:hypothetical protein